jgi:hypothetical protein
VLTQVAEGVLTHESEIMQSNTVIVQGQARVSPREASATGRPASDRCATRERESPPGRRHGADPVGLFFDTQRTDTNNR